jgi:hypothetical protein
LTLPLSLDDSIYFYVGGENFNRSIPSASYKNLNNLIFEIIDLVSKDYQAVYFQQLAFYDDLRANKFVTILPMSMPSLPDYFVKAESIDVVRKYRFPDIGRKNSPIYVVAGLVEYPVRDDSPEEELAPIFIHEVEDEL